MGVDERSKNNQINITDFYKKVSNKDFSPGPAGIKGSRIRIRCSYLNQLHATLNYLHGAGLTASGRGLEPT